MKHFILISVLAFCVTSFAQTKETVNHTLKKGSQEIVFSLPEGTVINDGNSLTVMGWPATITVIEKSIYDNDSLPKKSDSRMLDAVFNENLALSAATVSAKPIAEITLINNGATGVAWVEGFKDATLPAKVSGCMVAGDYIVKISMDCAINKENLLGSEHTYKQYLFNILGNVTVLQDGQRIFPDNTSVTYKNNFKALKVEFENPFSLSSPLIISPRKQ